MKKSSKKIIVLNFAKFLITIIGILAFIAGVSGVNQRSKKDLIGKTQLEAAYENDYSDDTFWEWHTRTTTNDKAYNGNHIVINKGKSIDFFGYWQNSYKDYLYKEYLYAGKKIFKFAIDETKANYHTLDGAGFIFNAKKENNLLSGYILLIRQNDICLYRLENVNATTFETGSNAIIETYAGKPIKSVAKTADKVHNLVITTEPTKVKIVDNGKEIFDVELDYLKHAGEDFGLLASYAQHSCEILSQIQFLDFKLEIQNYNVPVKVTDVNGNGLQGAEFQVKNEAGEIIREGMTNEEGIYKIEGLPEGIYSFEEVKVPPTYASNNTVYKFKMTSDGKVLDVDTGKEISFSIINKKLEFLVKVLDKENNPIKNSKVSLYNKDGTQVLDLKGNPIVVSTKEDGSAVITDINTGTYIFKQTEVPQDYKLNKTEYTVTIDEDGKVQFKEDDKGIIFNEKIEQQKTPSKPDSSSKGNVVSNGNNVLNGNKPSKYPHAGIGFMILIFILVFVITAIYYGARTHHIKNI